MNGLVGEPDPETAILWLRRSMALDNPRAFYLMSNYCMRGIGVEQDAREGMALLKKSAEMGVPAAQLTLGRFLRDIPGVNHQRDGLKWIRKAAMQGFEEAVRELERIGG